MASGLTHLECAGSTHGAVPHTERWAAWLQALRERARARGRFWIRQVACHFVCEVFSASCCAVEPLFGRRESGSVFPSQNERQRKPSLLAVWMQFSWACIREKCFMVTFRCSVRIVDALVSNLEWLIVSKSSVRLGNGLIGAKLRAEFCP